MGIGKHTGYGHQRMIGRANMDSSMRPTNFSENVMGAFALGALLIPFVVIAMLFD